MSDNLEKQIHQLFSANGGGFTLEEIQALRKAFSLILERIQEVEDALPE